MLIYFSSCLNEICCSENCIFFSGGLDFPCCSMGSSSGSVSTHEVLLISELCP